MSLKAGLVTVAGWLGLIAQQVNAPPPQLEEDQEDQDEDAPPSAEALEARAEQLRVQAEAAAAAAARQLAQAEAERVAAARGQEAVAAQGQVAQLPAALAPAEAVFARPEPVAAAEALRVRADQAARALNALVGAAEVDWTAAKAVAAEALRQADAALRALAEAVAAERGARRDKLAALVAAAKALENPVPPDALALVKPSHRYRKDLVAQQAAAPQILADLRDAAETAPIAAFASGCAAAEAAIEAIRRQAALVARAAEDVKNQKAEQQRQAEVEALRWTRGQLDRGVLDILADPKPGEAFAAAFKVYVPAFAALEKAAGDGFEAARREASAAYDALERAFATALGARDAESRLRRAALADLRQRAAAVTTATTPLSGTPESATLFAARRVCTGAVEALDESKVMNGRPDVFIAAQAAAEQALQALAGAAADASEAAKQRAAAFLALKNTFKADVAAAVADAPNGPSSALKDPVALAVRTRGQQDWDALRGVDPAADGAIVAAFAAWRPAVRALAGKLNGIDAAQYAAVAANAEVKAAAKALLDQIAAAGVGQAAEGFADALKAAVAAIVERYATIDGLQPTYDDILAHDGYVPAWRPEIEKYTALKAARNDLIRGQLTVRTNEARDALALILGRCEQRALRELASEAYRNSAEGLFLEFVQTHNPGQIADEMARLVGVGTATQGDINRAYVAGDDDAAAGEFSVEVRIDIDGAHGVVTHAHCDVNGAPKAGFACHFKLANAKYGKTAYALKPAARAALVPGAAAIMGARAGVWNGWRPDWV